MMKPPDNICLSVDVARRGHRVTSYKDDLRCMCYLQSIQRSQFLQMKQWSLGFTVERCSHAGGSGRTTLAAVGGNREADPGLRLFVWRVWSAAAETRSQSETVCVCLSDRYNNKQHETAHAFCLSAAEVGAVRKVFSFNTRGFLRWQSIAVYFRFAKKAETSLWSWEWCVMELLFVIDRHVASRFL